jgi:hypothetical protein
LSIQAGMNFIHIARRFLLTACGASLSEVLCHHWEAVDIGLKPHIYPPYPNYT